MGRIGITLSRWGELGSNYLDGQNWDYIIKMWRIGITLSRWGELGLHYQDGENWDYTNDKNLHRFVSTHG
jgi:hypothetical protein